MQIVERESWTPAPKGNNAEFCGRARGMKDTSVVASGAGWERRKCGLVEAHRQSSANPPRLGGAGFQASKWSVAEEGGESWLERRANSARQQILRIHQLPDTSISSFGLVRPPGVVRGDQNTRGRKKLGERTNRRSLEDITGSEIFKPWDASTSYLCRSPIYSIATAPYHFSMYGRMSSSLVKHVRG